MRLAVTSSPIVLDPWSPCHAPFSKLQRKAARRGSLEKHMHAPTGEPEPEPEKRVAATQNNETMTNVSISQQC